jgi:hypothetical protein
VEVLQLVPHGPSSAVGSEGHDSQDR